MNHSVPRLQEVNPIVIAYLRRQTLTTEGAIATTGADHD